MTSRKQSYTIVNTVVSTRLGGFIDIEKLFFALPGCQYEPGSFPGLVMRRRDLHATLVLFSTGRFVAMARSLQIAITALEGVAKEISETLSINSSIEEPKTENMVATTDFHVPIDLDMISKTLGCTYEPEQFPGAICYLPESVVLLVFHTGKANCVGAKNEASISEAFEWLERGIMRFSED